MTSIVSPKRRGRPPKYTGKVAEAAGEIEQADDSAAGKSGLVVNEALFSAFLVRLDAFICSHGMGYVISATHPDADGETLESDYPVTITKGPARAVTAYCERQVTI
jgi:hypothetical protein